MSACPFPGKAHLFPHTCLLLEVITLVEFIVHPHPLYADSLLSHQQMEKRISSKAGGILFPEHN